MRGQQGTCVNSRYFAHQEPGYEATYTNTLAMQKRTMSRCRNPHSLNNKPHRMLVVIWRVNKTTVPLKACHRQPTLQSLSAAVHAVPIMTLLTSLRIWEKSKTPHVYGHHKSFSRSIQATWYEEHVCDTSTYKVFCHMCISARSQGLIIFSKHCKLSFVTEHE